MAFSSGRLLTSFGRDTDVPRAPARRDPGGSLDDDGHFIPTALDFAYRALKSHEFVQVSLPDVLLNARAVDSASFVGSGATFAVYRRRLPLLKRVKQVNILGGHTSRREDARKLPAVIAYKVAMIEFSDMGEASSASRHLIDAAIMELYLLAHRPILDHPNLVDFLGLAWGTNPFNPLQKLPVLVVEFAESGSLLDLQQREHLGLDTRRRLCLDVCQGLDMLHSCGIVHGDIKAENILIFPDEIYTYKAKLSDFGFSLVSSPDNESLCLGGTRLWKAPEAKTAVKASDAKYTDVYSLALLIWCTFAHGQNIFRVLFDGQKQGEEFYAEAERMKESGELPAQTNLSTWYAKTLRSPRNAESVQLDNRYTVVRQRVQQQLGQVRTGAFDFAPFLEDFEELICCQRHVGTSPWESLLPGTVNAVESSGLYGAMQQAVQIGLSNEPSKRDVRQMMVCLGHDNVFTETAAPPGPVLEPISHKFSWSNWTWMEPSVQKYLTAMYIERSETDIRRQRLNPPEAFLLSALYINGYGVDRDLSQAFRWLHLAWSWRGQHKLAAAYGFRIARAIGAETAKVDEMRSSLKAMARRGSRTALQDLAPQDYEETKAELRDKFSGTGADFFLPHAMRNGRDLEALLRTLRNVPVLLANFSQLHDAAEFKVNNRGDRLLHCAASLGQTKAIEALLNQFPSMDVNQLNDQSETPLLCASRAGQSETVLWLTSHGANASLGRPSGESPLHWLISFEDDEVERVGSAMMRAGAETNASTTTLITYHPEFPASMIPDRLPLGYPIGWATHCDRPSIVKFLLDKMEDTRLCNDSLPRGWSALEIAASQHRAECLDLMVSAIELAIGGPGGYKVTSLLSSAVSGPSLFDMILYHGPRYWEAMDSTFRCLLPRANRVANGSGYGGFNQSLLYCAVSLARDEQAEYLLRHGVDVMKTGADYDEEILQSQDVGAFKPTHVNRACGVDLRTPLLEAVRWNRPSLVQLLLEHGARVSDASKNPFTGQESTWTALHVLADAGQDDPRLVGLLLDRGAPLDGHPDHLLTTESPLLIALQTDAFRLADCLLSLGADVNLKTLGSAHLGLTQATTILGHIIATNARNSIARLRHVLDGASSARAQPSFIVEPARQWTALHRAAAAHLDTTFRGTDVTEASPLEWSDVDWAANREILNELLRHFGRPDHVDATERSRGLTAMHLAVLAGNEGAVSLLLEHGARCDLSSRGANGSTAASLALEVTRFDASSVTAQGIIWRRKEEVAAREKCRALLNGS